MLRVDVSYDVNHLIANENQDTGIAIDTINMGDKAFVVFGKGGDVTFKVMESDNQDMHDATEVEAICLKQDLTKPVLTNTVKIATIGVKEGSTKRYIRLDKVSGDAFTAAIFENLR